MLCVVVAYGTHGKEVKTESTTKSNFKGSPSKSTVPPPWQAGIAPWVGWASTPLCMRGRKVPCVVLSLPACVRRPGGGPEYT
eukprot:2169453-Amphidinium_carterae.1